MLGGKKPESTNKKARNRALKKKLKNPFFFCFGFWRRVRVFLAVIPLL